MTTNSDRFWDEASQRIQRVADSGASELWKPILSQLTRPDGDGDSVKEWLETEQQRFIRQIEDRIDELRHTIGE